MVINRSSEAAVAAESGSRSLEPGLRWSSSTGGPLALPHSDQATRRPSARVRTWSPIGVVAGVDIIFFLLHRLVSAPLRRVKPRWIRKKPPSIYSQPIRHPLPVVRDLGSRGRGRQTGDDDVESLLEFLIVVYGVRFGQGLSERGEGLPF